MDADFVIDDAGNGTDGRAWPTAYPNLDALLANETLTGGEVIAWGHNSADPFVYSALKTYAFPVGIGQPVALVSVQQGVGSVAGGGFVPLVATANNLDSLKDGAFGITMSGNFRVHGLRIASGSTLTFSLAAQSAAFIQKTTWVLGAGSYVSFSGGTAKLTMNNVTLDLSADTGTLSTRCMLVNGCIDVSGMTIVGGSNRTGRIFDTTTSASSTMVTGLDISSMTNASPPAIIGGSLITGSHRFENVKAPAGVTLTQTGTTWRGGHVDFVGVGPTKAIWHIGRSNPIGSCAATTAISRDSGLQIGGNGVSVNVLTDARCSRHAPFYTPWLYDTFGTTGTKGLDIYLTNDTQDYTNADIALEVQFQDTAGQYRFGFATSLDLSGTTLMDETGAWSGSGPSFTFKQILSIRGLVVNEAGLFRARLAIGIPSLGASDHFYFEPQMVQV